MKFFKRQSASMMSGVKEKRLLIGSMALLAGLPLLFLWRVVFQGDILLSLDMLLTYEPWRSEIPGSIAFPLWNELMADPVRKFYPVALYIRESWQNGQIPFWYPYAGNGMPILSAGYFQVLYPLNNLLWQIMPVYHAFGWSTILHLFLGSLFTVMFMQELGVKNFGRMVAAVSFTYSSSLVIWLGLPSSLSTMVWLPFIFWAVERAIGRQNWQWSLLGAFGVLMQILAGQVQLVLYTFTALLLYACCRAVILWQQERKRGWTALSPLIYAALSLAAGSALGAFQLLPLAELIPTIRRSEGNVDLYNSAWGLLRTLIPDIWGANIDGLTMPGYRFEVYLYLGLLPLFFMMASLFSPRAWLARCLVGLGVFFLLVIFNVPPFFQLFYYLYPTFPTLGLLRTMFIIVFWWAVAAGIGADWLLSSRPSRVLRLLLTGGLVLGGLALFYLMMLAFLSKYQDRHFWNLPALPEFQPSLLYHLSSVLFSLVLLAAILFLLWSWIRARISPAMFVTLSIALIIFDLFLAHLDFAPVLPKHLLYPVTPSLSFLQQEVKKETQPFRISGVGRVLWPNTGGVFSLPVVQVYNSFLSQRYFEYAEASGARAPSNLRVITYYAQASRLLDALNVKYLYTPRDLLAAGDGISLLTEVEPPQIESDFSEAGQVFEWAINNWSQEVLVAPAPSVVHYHGALPGRFQLETAIAVDPQFWQADGVLFEIYATQPGQPPAAPIFSQALRPRENPDDRQWIPVQLDLSAYAQQPLVLSFVTKPQGAPGSRGGWANPLLVNAEQWQLLYYGPNSIYENKQVLPRAWVVHRVTTAPPGNLAAVKAQLARPDFDPALEAVVEGPAPAMLTSPLPETPAAEKVNITRYHPSRVEISAELAEAGLLILSDLYYPGWQVYVDGQLRSLLAVNLVMRGVYLEPGRHQVVFSYEPQSFRWGIYLGVGTLVGIVIALVVAGLYRHARAKPAREKNP
ncbi:MAG: YfhO family protein [Anaerolineae bacterium]|nr:YfhO family protein [Anaerolineae bacterium]